MKKEENQLQQAPKSRSVYRYQLKATNQILKDTRDLCHSSIYSTARTNKLHHPNYEDYDLSPFHEKQLRNNHHSLPSKSLQEKYSQQPAFEDFCRQKNDKKLVFQEFGLLQSSFQKEKQPKSFYKKPREDEQFDASDFLNPHFVSYSEDNEHYLSNRIPSAIDRSVESQSKKMINPEGKKELKKQRRGLAEISLKVKNIVARMRKMTFKEVSDEVLKQSQEDLPQDPEQRQKQTKNIRRRVYDALNVLVSVNILGKQQRCVVHTAATSIPGKKLSEHWHIISQKNRLLQQKKNDYKKKVANLNLLKKNIEMMQKFYDRNRKINEKQDKKDESTCSQMRESQVLMKKWHFPLVFLVPPRNLQSKIKIQLQFLQSKQDYIKKITIDNNDYILTDLDVLKYINLNRINQLHDKKQNIVIEKIKNVKDVNSIDEQKVEKEICDLPSLQD